MVASIALVALRTSVKHQALAINLPLRLRWNFHRLMLGQSMALCRRVCRPITAKIMQTALAVRDMIFTTTDVVVGMACTSSPSCCWPGALMRGCCCRLRAGWCYGLVCWYFVPRLGKVSHDQADARALMTGRITDAYTNIATVKLFFATPTAKPNLPRPPWMPSSSPATRRCAW